MQKGSIKMIVSDNLDVNKAGNLTIGGVDTVALAKKYGTPLYVMDEDMIRRDCKIFQKSIDTGNGLLCQQSFFLQRNLSCHAVGKYGNRRCFRR